MNYADPDLVGARRAGTRAADLAYHDANGDGPRAGGIDRHALLATLRRERWLAGAILLAALLCGVATLFLSTPRFRAVASIQIDQRSARVLGSEDAEPLEGGAEADRFLQTEVDILASRSLAIRVAQDLHLLENDGFFAAMAARPPQGGGAAARREAVLALLRDNLRVTLPRNSRVVQVSFDSHDPVTAAAVANSYCTSFIYANLQRRFATSRYSRAFLEAQLGATKARLEASERALIGYARSAGLVDASAGVPTGPAAAEGPRSLTTANLVDVNQAYAAAHAARIAAEQRWRGARAAALMSLPEVLGNPAVQQLTQRRAELQGELEQLRQRLKPDHPTMKQAQAQIAALDAQIQALATGLLGSLEDQYRTAARQEQGLGRSLRALKGRTLAEQDRGIRYNILKREVDTNRQLYDGLLGRFKEVSAEAGITSNNVTVVDVAEPPLRPVAPRPLATLVVALLAGLAVAALAIALRARFDDVVRTPADLEEKLGLPLLGTVPRLRGGETPLAALDDPRSPMVEAHQSIRTALELASDQGMPRTLLVTSSRPGEGKTSAALAIARDLAGAARVLLVDADLRAPSLHELHAMDNDRGLSTVLARRDPPLDAVRPTGHAGLDLLPAGPQPPNPAQLLNGAALPMMLAEYRRHYDFVVLDGPPVLALADAPRLAGNAAATVFVIEADRSHGGGVRLALRRLAQAQAHLAGAILTKFEARAAAYGDAYRFGYGTGA